MTFKNKLKCKKGFKCNLLVVLFLVLICDAMLIASIGNAETEPEWINQVPDEDQTYKYYIGVSDNVTDINTGLEQARVNATQDAIRNNFGIETQVKSESLFSDAGSNSLQFIRQISGKILLTGFELKSTYIVDKKGNQKTIYTLYRYKKSEIENSKKLLSSWVNKNEGQSQNQNRNQNQNSLKIHKGLSNNNFDYTLIGESKDFKNGSLFINTRPSRATIIIDGVTYPKSPIKIVGELKPGKHKIIIDHPDSATYEEEFEIKEDQLTVIDKVLKPAKALVDIDSEPSGAEVYFNNEKIGKTPLLNYEVDAGKPYTIILYHPDSYPFYLQNYTISKNQHANENVKLKLMNGKLKIKKYLNGSRVYIDDNGVYVNSDGVVDLQPGSYIISILYKDLSEFRDYIHIKSNKTTEVTYTKFEEKLEQEKYISQNKIPQNYSPTQYDESDYSRKYRTINPPKLLLNIGATVFIDALASRHSSSVYPVSSTGLRPQISVINPEAIQFSLSFSPLQTDVYSRTTIFLSKIKGNLKYEPQSEMGFVIDSYSGPGDDTYFYDPKKNNKYYIPKKVPDFSANGIGFCFGVKSKADDKDNIVFSARFGALLYSGDGETEDQMVVGFGEIGFSFLIGE